MTFSWRLHLFVFWVAFLTVCIVALFVGWNTTSVMTDEEATYLVYETAFLGLLIVLGLFIVISSHQIGKMEKRENEIENEIIVWAVRGGWQRTVWSEDLEDWTENRIENEKEEGVAPIANSGEDIPRLMREYRFLSDAKRNAWKKLLGPVLQLIFLVTICSAAIPSAYWFLQVNPNINTISAIVVLGGTVVTTLYAFSSLFFLCPKVNEGE